MALIATIKAATDSNIRQQTAAESISQDIVANQFDALSNELLARGIVLIDTDADAATQSAANAKLLFSKTGSFFYHNGTSYVKAGGSAPVEPPSVTTGNDITITAPASSVTLAGSAVPSAGRTIANRLWTKIAGPSVATIQSVNQAETLISNLAPGTYYFSFAATDSGNLSSSDTITVTVLPDPNGSPDPDPNPGTGGGVALNEGNVF